MTTPLAVAIFHGIGSQGPDFAEGVIRDLTGRIAALLPDAKEPPLVFKAIHWGSALCQQEEALCSRRWIPPYLGWQRSRRQVVRWLGDAIAYEPTTRSRAAYDAVLACVASQLEELAGAAGDEAPLCVVAHSFGSVIANDYFYDLQRLDGARATSDPALEVAENIRGTAARSVLAAGKTLAMLITLGSPLGVLSLRCPKVAEPLSLPGASVKQRYPQIEGLWLNFVGLSDILASPLAALSPSYESLVTDVPVKLRGLFTGWNPLSHFRYWDDPAVLQSIAAALSGLWRDANPVETPPQARSRSALAYGR
jgi:hypothetical protein